FALAQPAHAYNRLSDDDIARVRQVKELLGPVDKKSMRDTILELEKSRKPQLNLELKEAMAKAYADIAREYQITSVARKEWLYSMVCLNMAYLQFSGTASKEKTTDLNRLIRQKLKQYLPPDIMEQPGFFNSL